MVSKFFGAGASAGAGGSETAGPSFLEENQPPLVDCFRSISSVVLLPGGACCSLKNSVAGALALPLPPYFGLGGVDSEESPPLRVTFWGTRGLEVPSAGGGGKPP